MIENPLELGGGLCRLMRREERLAAHVRRVESPVERSEADDAQREVEGRGRLQRLNRR